MARDLERYAARRLELAAKLMHTESKHEHAFALCIVPECASLKAQIQTIQQENR